MNHIRRWAAMLCAAVLLFSAALAEAGASLPDCRTKEEVVDKLLFPSAAEDGACLPAGIQAGQIRYISQLALKDPLFCADYWIGDEPGGPLDLTRKKDAAGKEYAYYSGTMCTRAVYSMALSYLGIDCTPGDMSRLTGLRSLDEPYDIITEQIDGLERVTFKTYVFQNMFECYVNDPSYSPVYIYLRKPNGGSHALLVVARDDDERYLVVDPSPHSVGGQPVYVFLIRFGTTFRSIINATFRDEYKDSVILGFYQWRLVGEEAS